MPKLLIINTAMNHPNWLFLPAFHNAIPFQTRSHNTKIEIKSINHTALVNIISWPKNIIF